MKKLLFLIIVIALITSIQSETISVSGEVSGTWSTDTVLVEGDLSVLNGTTLTINPGTYVEFQGHYKLQVSGRLLAIGTEEDSVTFTGITPQFPWEDDTWEGIKIKDVPANADSTHLIHCVIEKSDNCGIYIEEFSNVNISHSRISNNTNESSGAGIYCRHSSPLITNNLICGNTCTGEHQSGAGLFCNASRPKILNNNICHNSARYGGGDWRYVWRWFSNTK